MSDMPRILIPIDTRGKDAHCAKKSLKSTEEKNVANEEEMMMSPSMFLSLARW
jgi:hypothetical protein